VEGHVKANLVDMLAIAGDLFDAAVLNSENARLAEFVGAIKMEHLGAVIFGIPEPRKKYLLANSSAGKNETEETIRDAMRKMCFLLAAKRRVYPDLPCVVLYHGEIAGTTLQNDQTVERGTGISITIDDLADIGADYYALGHIHKPQRVGTLQAYYAGSVYPKNFGETQKAGFNVADVGAGPYIVQRYDFPHPQNMKIETTLDEFLKSPRTQGRRRTAWTSTAAMTLGTKRYGWKFPATRRAAPL